MHLINILSYFIFDMDCYICVFLSLPTGHMDVPQCCPLLSPTGQGRAGIPCSNDRRGPSKRPADGLQGTVRNYTWIICSFIYSYIIQGFSTRVIRDWSLHGRVRWRAVTFVQRTFTQSRSCTSMETWCWLSSSTFTSHRYRRYTHKDCSRVRRNASEHHRCLMHHTGPGDVQRRTGQWGGVGRRWLLGFTGHMGPYRAAVPYQRWLSLTKTLLLTKPN